VTDTNWTFLNFPPIRVQKRVPRTANSQSERSVALMYRQ